MNGLVYAFLSGASITFLALVAKDSDPSIRWLYALVMILTVVVLTVIYHISNSKNHY